MMTANITLGIPAQNIITASMMSILALIAISEVHFPELDEPMMRGHVLVDHGEGNAKDAPVNVLHAFAKGALFGLILTGQVLCNVVTILSFVAAINVLLTWIGRGFGIHHLMLQLVLHYVFYLITFLLSTLHGSFHSPPSSPHLTTIDILCILQVCPTRRSCVCQISLPPNWL
jgi:CNT family concentrative nucleoside transporter